MTDSLTATRRFYDTIAKDYEAHFGDTLAGRPLDRAQLTAFAELTGEGTVADLGCGPGRITAYLASLGLSVYGLDLSESMLAIARREHPGLRFEQGSMTRLDLADGDLAGAVCWYSTIHTPDEELPALFAELYRALAPGAPLLLGFQSGEEPLRLDRPWGHPVALDFRRRTPERMTRLLERAGFALLWRTQRAQDTDRGETAPQAFVAARRPARPGLGEHRDAARPCGPAEQDSADG
ncbi:class I SAM-dependent methyltransferase [Streptomyces sp. NPDC006186]|uniref:class I SAM-dependent DNA methyltransferase n=1 Tax=Streptomyces sp. NPDC006186 TaxID=3155248 RepID=UPI0033AD0C36